MENVLNFPDYKSALRAAHAARAQGDLDAAADIYIRTAAAFVDDKHAVVAAASGLRACERWTDAVAALETALHRAPNSALLLSHTADAYVEIKDFARAAAYLRRYVDYDPRRAEAWLRLAQLYEIAGDWPNAEATFTHVVTAEPMNVTAGLGRGDALFQLARYEEALECYRRALLIEPNNALASFKLGSALMMCGQRSEAHQHLEKSVALEPTNARAHVNLGLIHLRFGELANAATLARQAVSLDPHLQIAHTLLGIALAERGDLEEAAAALSTASASTENTEALFMLGAVEAARGERRTAELAYQRILALAPENREARHNLAALHGESIRAPSHAFAGEAFDRVAAQYDAHEVNVARYQAPDELAILLEHTQPERNEIERLLDIGCGTGLAAAALGDAFGIGGAVGFDVSARMLDLARAKGIYEDLLLGNALDGLDGVGGAFDVVIAADLFPYLGDLSGIMNAVARKLRPGGVFCYSIELSQGARVELAPTGRYIHSNGYVRDLARDVGLTSIGARPLILRRTFGRDISGVVGLLQRPA